MTLIASLDVEKQVPKSDLARFGGFLIGLS